MTQVVSLPLSEVLDNPAWKNRIRQITAQSYKNPEVLLEQEFYKNNQAYLSISPSRGMDAFFLVGWARILLSQGETDCVFLGLSAADELCKGTPIAVSLYRRFFADAAARAVQTGQRVAWWFHTASPIVAGLMWKIAPNIGPSIDGRLSPFQNELLRVILEKHSMSAFRDPERAFVLRGIAKARYSSQETSRLSRRSERRTSPIDLWHVEEKNGDRVLFVGHCL